VRGSLVIAVTVLAIGGPSVALGKNTPPPSELVFVTDPSFNMESGVRTVTSVSRMLFQFDDRLRDRIPLDETRPAGRALGVLGRIARAFWIDVPLIRIQEALIHEIFGHGARGREAGLEPQYDFYLPEPYSTLLSSDRPGGVTDDARTGSLERDITMTIGGLESEYWGAWWLTRDMMARQGWMHYRDLLQYAVVKMTYFERWVADLSRKPDDQNSLWDPDNYLTELQRRFNRWRSEDRESMAKKLQLAYLYNFVDPTFWLCCYHVLYTYLFNGVREVRLPQIPVWRWRLYPSTRFNISPFGAEHYLDLFARLDLVNINLYGRWGSSGLASYWGGGLRFWGYEPGLGLSLGAELDLWSQPEILFDQRFVFSRDNLAGVNIGVHLSWKVYGQIAVTGKLAHKTRGYAMGQPVPAGIHGYFGVAIAADAEGALLAP
jgi:hypothetical protein